MTKPKLNEAVITYWLKYYREEGVCTLCVGSGMVHRDVYCICPNGQTLRRELVPVRARDQKPHRQQPAREGKH